MKYENITQKVLLSIESILKNAKQLQHARLTGQVRSLLGRSRKSQQ